MTIDRKNNLIQWHTPFETDWPFGMLWARSSQMITFRPTKTSTQGCGNLRFFIRGNLTKSCALMFPINTTKFKSVIQCIHSYSSLVHWKQYQQNFGDFEIIGLNVQEIKVTQPTTYEVKWTLSRVLLKMFRNG
jgi:hypothetical protein